MDVREVHDGERIVPPAERGVLLVLALRVWECGEHLVRHLGESGRGLRDRDERGVEDPAHPGDFDLPRLSVEDRGDAVDRVLPRDRVERPVDLGKLFALGDLVGHPRLGLEVALEDLLRTLLVVRRSVVPEEAPVLVLRVAVPGVREERRRGVGSVLFAEL